MGYRHKYGGYAERTYQAVVIIRGEAKIITYRSVFGKRQFGNFSDLRAVCERQWGITIRNTGIDNIITLEK